jgi:hypothetical protein
MLSWSTIVYGAAISALPAAVAVALVERIRPSGASMPTVSAFAAIGAFLGPWLRMPCCARLTVPGSSSMLP